MFNTPHLDAAQTIFFTRQLEEIDSELYNVKYAALEAFELVQAKTNLHPGTETYTYRQYDGRGIAKMTSNYSTQSPRVDVDGHEFSSSVRGIRASFGYNVQEIRAAAKAGLPLDSMRAEQARRAINEKINSTALLGDAEHGIKGLFNIANAQTFTVPKNAGNTSTLWANKTADEILDDMVSLVDQVPTNTAEVEHVTRLLIPHGEFRRITSTRMSALTKETVLEAFKMMRPGVEVRGAQFLSTAGAGGLQRMMGYDPSCCKFMLPIPFESFAPQQQGLEFVVELHARAGGVVCPWPMSTIYGDGI